MTLFKSLLIALSTYSAIPVRQFAWSGKSMKYALCFFPFVGVLVGAALSLWYVLAAFLDISPFFFAAGAACLPLLITGGIHMDGYMDTVDALSSRQSRERKLEIMKDSHCGAFAVIYCGIYLLLQSGLFYELFEQKAVFLCCLVFTLSRTLSALCALTMPNARETGMLRAYTKDADHRIAVSVLFVLLLLLCTAMILLFSIKSLLLLATAAIVLLIYRRLAMKHFGGVTGDTSGFFLQLCELSCIFAVWLGEVLL